MNFRKVLQFSIILAGATAMASQIVFLREFLVVFYGNEISIGIILASWLVWGAFGSWGLGRFSDSVRNKVRLFSLCQFGLFLILPATLFAARACKSFIGITTGEILGYYPMVITTFIVLSLSCAVMGFMFSLACRVYRGMHRREADIPARGIAHVYVLEALGALTGGLLVSFFLIRFLDAVNIIFMLAFLNLIGSLAMQWHSELSRTKNILFRGTLIILVFGLLAFFSGGRNQFRQASLNLLWKGYDVIESKDSIYGNITVTRRDIQRSFYENGLGLYTVPDALSSEEAVHFALLEHEKPENVLLIGGGVGGLVKEILKYPVRRVDYVELDPVIVEIARRHLDRADVSFLDHSRVKIINADGRRYVKKTKIAYDCIIVHLGDPYTAQLNRFYTVDFFREARHILRKKGIIAFGLTSAENYIGEELKSYLSSIYFSLKEVFPEILLIPGDTAYFIASGEKGILTSDHKELERRLEEREINTLYVREYYLFSKLSSERLDYAANAIKSGKDIRRNTDFRPISYFYAMVFWGTQFDTPIFRKFLRSVVPENVWLVTVAFCALFLMFFFFARKRRIKRAVLSAVLTTGFAEISFQIVVILSFQVIYGFVFYKLGVIVTSFMIGLAIGGWYIARKMPKIKNDLAYFRWTQVSICLYPLLLPAIFLGFSRSHSDVVSWFGSNCIFPFFPVIAGIIGGIQFPLANRIYLGGAEKVGRVAGLSYGLDLLGACLGALVVAAFLVPVLGIFGTCFLVALINVTVLGVLLLK